jgi:ribosome-associated protein
LDKITTALKTRTKAPVRTTRNSKLFKEIIEAIKEKKGESIVSLDLRNIDEAVADFFIICDAQSAPQVKAIADSIRDRVAVECDEKPFHTELGEEWTLVDYVNIVVHIFRLEQRKFYDLESLWADAGTKEHAD